MVANKSAENLDHNARLAGRWIEEDLLTFHPEGAVLK
jgi:hypothetical protein